MQFNALVKALAERLAKVKAKTLTPYKRYERE